MIELKGISRVYRPKKGLPVRALDKVTLTFEKTGMVFVLGKSGSGKSTLLNVVGGLDKFDEGELIIKGKSTNNFTQSDYDSYRNTMIGFIFQEYNVLDDFTVAQNIGLALELQGHRMTDEAISRILGDVDMDGYAKRKPNELSGGQVQRVAIARALVKNPEIIMADEPTGALDSVTGRQVLETLERLSKDRLVIVVSHDREFAETYGTRIIEFKDGSVISDVSRQKATGSEARDLDFAKDRIKVRQGYRLTDEDFAVINAYLAKSDKDTTIEKVFSQAKFTGTKQEELVTQAEDLHLIKSKLPFRSSLKIGASSLKHKKFRLVLSILLASVAFGLFGLSDVMGSYNKTQAAVSSISDSHLNYAAVIKQQNFAVGEEYSWSSTVKLDDGDLADLKTAFPALDFKPVYVPQFETLSFTNYLANSMSGTDMFSSPTFTGFFELTDEDLPLFNAELLGASSRLPVTDQEIAVSLYTYNIFKKYGFRLNGNKVSINNYGDLLNRQIELGSVKYTITGIVDTGFNDAHFEKLKDITEIAIQDYLLVNELHEVLSYSHHSMAYVCDGFIQNATENVGLSNYNGLYSFQISSGSGSDGKYMYANYLKRTSQIDFDKVVPMKNTDLGDLEKNDVVMTVTSLGELYGDDLESRYVTSATVYVSSLDLEDIRTALEVSEPVAEWTEQEKTEYRNEFFETYYRDKLKTVPAGLKSVSDLKTEVAADYFSGIDPVTMQLELYSYFGFGSKNKTVRLAGVSVDDDYRNSSIAVSQELYDELGIVEDGPYNSAISYLDSSDRATIRALMNEHYSKKTVKYTVRNEVLSTLDNINSMFETLAKVFLSVGIAFAVFASLLLFNYISTSISYKKQEIGILRAIGARGNDVLSIFLLEASIIALINFVLSTIMVIVAVIWINTSLRVNYNLLITILTYGIRQFFLMLAVSLFAAFVSSALPVTRIARKRPIDAIRNR